MNLSTRKPLLFAVFVAAALTAPIALAQSQETAEPADTAAATADAAASADAQASKKSWADVDGDKDGNLTKTEAAAVPALGQVFDQADANADGSLTPEEYKNYVAKAKGGSEPASAPQQK